MSNLEQLNIRPSDCILEIHHAFQHAVGRWQKGHLCFSPDRSSQDGQSGTSTGHAVLSQSPSSEESGFRSTTHGKLSTLIHTPNPILRGLHKLDYYVPQSPLNHEGPHFLVFIFYTGTLYKQQNKGNGYCWETYCSVVRIENMGSCRLRHSQHLCLDRSALKTWLQSKGPHPI